MALQKFFNSVYQNKENNGDQLKENTVDNSAVKIYSEKTHQELWLVKDADMQQKLIDDGVDFPVFTFSEIEKMDEDLSNNTLQHIYNMKKVFEGTSVEKVSKAEPQK